MCVRAVEMRSVSIALAHSRTVLMTNHKRTFKLLILEQAVAYAFVFVVHN
jgi:hypothetical protein